MNTIRRFSSICLAILIILLSAFPCGFYSYASVNDDPIYVPLRSESDLVKSFQAYCKSRDLTIEGSLTDAVTTFTTGAFNSACNEIGIDISELQAEIKAEYDETGKPVKFLFNTTGVMAMNRIFAQFLQDNELEVGDIVDDQEVYSGMYFTDYDGISTLCYIANNNGSTLGGVYEINILSKGTPYKFNTNDLVSLVGDSSYTPVYHLTESTTYNAKTYTKYSGGWADNISITDRTSNSFGTYVMLLWNDGTRKNGFPIIKYNSTNNNLYLSWLQTASTKTNNKLVAFDLANISKTQASFAPTNIYITTNNNTINNNNYEGDTIINNDGEPSSPDVPTPTPDPDYTPAEDWDIDLPDLNVPNWIISGKENKFPFDIPFNVMYALTLLQAEPEAPHLEGTLDLTIYQWEYDLDLSQFDTVALICRNMEFLAFLTGLMLMTRKLIWG